MDAADVMAKTAKIAVESNITGKPSLVRMKIILYNSLWQLCCGLFLFERETVRNTEV